MSLPSLHGLVLEIELIPPEKRIQKESESDIAFVLVAFEHKGPLASFSSLLLDHRNCAEEVAGLFRWRVDRNGPPFAFLASHFAQRFAFCSQCSSRSRRASVFYVSSGMNGSNRQRWEPFDVH